MINYADDFVILSRRSCGRGTDLDAQCDDAGRPHAERGEDQHQAGQERFDFLGYSFGPHRYRKEG